MGWMNPKTTIPLDISTADETLKFFAVIEFKVRIPELCGSFTVPRIFASVEILPESIECKLISIERVTFPY